MGFRMSVLIVDDQRLLAEIFSDAFRMVGDTAQVAVDGRDAARLAARHSYDVLVTDLLMPEFDGLELIRAVKRLNRPAPKIIAVTGGGHFPAEDLLEVACKLGADSGLAKPFDPFELVRLARRLTAETQRDELVGGNAVCWN